MNLGSDTQGRIKERVSTTVFALDLLANKIILIDIEKFLVEINVYYYYGVRWGTKCYGLGLWRITPFPVPTEL